MGFTPRKAEQPLWSMELQEKEAQKPLKIKHRRKLKQRIPESSCARKETVDIDILVISRNGDRKIMQSIRVMRRFTSRKGKWNQLSQS